MRARFPREIRKMGILAAGIVVALTVFHDRALGEIREFAKPEASQFSVIAMARRQGRSLSMTFECSYVSNTLTRIALFPPLVQEQP